MLNFTSLNLTDCSHEDHKDNWTPTPPSFLSYLNIDRDQQTANIGDKPTLQMPRDPHFKEGSEEEAKQ